MKDDRLEELLSIAQIYKQDMRLITRDPIENKEDQLLLIYNKMDSIDNVSPPLRENFRLFILKMKLAMLSNCGFVTYDMEQNDSLKRLINQLNEIRFSLN
jgi:transcriptional/translational regulatory protein YebC/TACO1